MLHIFVKYELCINYHTNIIFQVLSFFPEIFMYQILFDSNTNFRVNFIDECKERILTAT